MKIWYQTMSTYGYDPLFEEYGKALAAHCQRAARPGTEIHVRGLPVYVTELDRYKSIMWYHQAQLMNNMLRAEKEGYDAFVQGNSNDIGIIQGREMLSIPVVGMLQSAVHMASILGERFAFITGWPFFIEIFRQLIVSYGLSSKFIPNYYGVPMQDEDMARQLTTPEVLAGKFREAAEKAVADGASVVIPLPAYIPQLLHKAGKLTPVNGATLMDPIAVSIKMAEAMVDLKKLGVDVSRTLQVYASPGKEVLKRAFETYKPVFKIDY